jgi:beta-galactosidase
VEGEFDRFTNPTHGYRLRGTGWYRKHFFLAEEDRARKVRLEFDGVLTHCTVWVNGHLMKRHFGGYMGFSVDISDVAYFGEKKNVVAVKVEAKEFEGWWYEGAGIYRHVWLVKTEAVHVEQWGVFVKPVKEAQGWRTGIETTVVNETDDDKTVLVRQRIVDKDKAIIGEAEEKVAICGGGKVCVKQEIGVKEPRLWSVDWPEMYGVETVIEEVNCKLQNANTKMQNGREEGTSNIQHSTFNIERREEHEENLRFEISDLREDKVETGFGYREVRFDAEKGFFLNGEAVKLKGTCNHQDHAGVGAAVPDAIWEYRVRRLKAMGSNAYRCAHNPPAPEFLDACDRLGMLVLDENRQFSSAEQGLEDLGAMVRRDRNHPSVFAWSLFNEEYMQAFEQGGRMARTMKRLVRELDDSRPVTAAIHTGFLEKLGVGQVVDVMGINYFQDNYDAYHQLYPAVPIMATEVTAATTTRGEYAEDAERGVCDAYDRMHPNFGLPVRQSWQRIAERAFVAGGFVWTGFDYRGEPEPYYSFRCISSHFGILDTCGFAKDAFYQYRAMWTDEPMVHILPHWNWAGREGQEIKVWCYSNCEEAELFLNGKSLGVRKVGRFEPGEWMVRYDPGELKVVGRKGGEDVASDYVQTTGPAVRIVLEGDRSSLRADGKDATVVNVAAVDAAGRIVPTAGNKVRFSVEGPGRIIGVGNGDPTCHEADKGTERSLFHGLAQVIVQSDRQAGKIVLKGEGEGLGMGEVRIEMNRDEDQREGR